VVPSDLANAILDIRDMYGAFRRRARIVPMASDNTAVVRRPGGTGASFIGEGVAATADTGTNFDSIRSDRQEDRRRSSCCRANWKRIRSSIWSIHIANEIGVAFAAKEDDCAFNGTGTSTYGKMRGIGSIVLDGSHAKAKVTASVNTYGA
jgi:HK97 family phage major capsid protein